jgi:hypothetical protein
LRTLHNVRTGSDRDRLDTGTFNVVTNLIF